MDYYRIFLRLFHIFFVGGFLMFVSLNGTNNTSTVFSICLYLGIIIAFYHLYKSFIRSNPWVNYFHIFIIAPILLIIGLYKENTSRKYFEILLMLSMASIGYHGYYLIHDL